MVIDRFFFLQVTPIEINEGLIIVEFFLPFFSNELIMRHSDSFVRMMSLLLLLFRFRKVRTIERAIIRMKQIYKYISIIDSTSPSIEFERKNLGRKKIFRVFSVLDSSRYRKVRSVEPL